MSSQMQRNGWGSDPLEGNGSDGKLSWTQKKNQLGEGHFYEIFFQM